MDRLTRLPKIGVCLIVALLAVAGPAAAQPLDRAYQRGVQAYERSQWELAIQEFEAILKTGNESFEIHYNLGNAYYRAGDVPGSVWAYQSALGINPGNKDAKHNLALARLKVKDRLEAPDIPYIISGYRALRDGFSPAQWLNRISLLLLIIAGFTAAGRMLTLKGLRALLILLWMISGVSALVAFDAIAFASRNREGVIYADVLTAYSAPSERATALFTLHAGATVTVTESGNQWVQIELLDGKSGWIPEEQLRPL